MSPRRKLLALQTAVLLCVVITAVAAIARWDVVVQIAIALLGGAAVILLLDLRVRSRDLAHMLRLAAGRQDALARPMADAAASVRGVGGTVTALARKVDGTAASVRALSDAVDSQGALVRVGLGAGGRVAEFERRVVASLESERLRAAERHAELTGALSSASETVQDAVSRVAQLPRVVERSAGRQTMDLLAIGSLDPEARSSLGLAAWEGMGVSPAQLVRLVEVARARSARTVLFAGGGTTAWIFSALAPQASVTLVEEPHAAAVLQADAEAAGLEGRVEVLSVPAVPDAGAQPFYDLRAVVTEGSLDLVVVCGPAARTAEPGLAAAFPAIEPVLARDGALVIAAQSRAGEEVVELDVEGVSRAGSAAGVTVFERLSSA